jgi:hypothetical protein
MFIVRKKSSGVGNSRIAQRLHLAAEFGRRIRMTANENAAFFRDALKLLLQGAADQHLSTGQTLEEDVGQGEPKIKNASWGQLSASEHHVQILL